ncbi:DNA methyltransferase [Amycolatopsis thermoflava]|uniref:DNA methyltransferase n=1 Tax=Amycolatopsis thermoflava TaxID=84480 RepID=UPI003F4A374A
MTDRPTSPWPLPLPPGEEPPMPPLSVWPTGQRDPLAQLRDAGCVPGTETDTERIPPAVAAHAIALYTRPGDLVLDPDCGAGSALVEALRAGRHVLGLTARNRWWTLARANVTAAKTAGAWHDGSVLDARPKVLATVRAAGLIGRVGLVLTTLRTAPTDPKNQASGPDRDPVESALADLATTLLYCEPLLRAGGHVVVIARPLRHPDGSLVDLTTPLITAATAAGLAPVERCIALTARLRGSRLVTRASLAERRAAARARAAGAPTALTAHHEVLVFQLAHEAELTAATAVGLSWPTEDYVVRPAVNGATYPGWRRAA